MSESNTVSPLRQHMIEDMAARKLNPHTQRSHIYSCQRFAAWLKRSPDTYLIKSGTSICNRNWIMTGVRFFPRHATSPRSGGRGLAHQGVTEAAAAADP
jgi:integrase/recombinase XerD